MADSAAAAKRSETVESDIEDFEDLIQENELESASDWTADDETRPVCLFCELTFENARQVWEHCAIDHSFDFNSLKRGLGLDFFGKLKLINYVRATVKDGKAPELNHPEVFLENSQYLKPVMEDDALLFGIQDDDDDDDDDFPSNESHENAQKVAALEEQLRDLRSQFTEYKALVKSVLNKELDSAASSRRSSVSSAGAPAAAAAATAAPKRDDDTHYFESYSYNEIHESMLKDTVRTESYRDFIYNNKDVFKDKVVLDVGCGTGILSMFCAKAGARKVIAVDNSNIIEKAIANVYENGLDGVITCLRGKIEDLTLPVDKVDIIVSEWMGYALLYEAMFDSVISARDRYLKPDGLMVPSECRLLVAGMHDDEFVNDKVNFWNDIYGFKMSAMKPRIFDEVLVESFPASAMVTEPAVFKTLPLHTISVPELDFSAPFTIPLDKTKPEALDGLVIYFDTYFTRSRDEVVEADARAESWTKPSGSLGFTTGPWGPKQTHWRSGALLFSGAQSVPVGDKLTGSIAYTKSTTNSREIEIDLELDTGVKTVKQQFHMR
ncbi:S-adenosyl-L-methionine-dependent methyltransferase [Dipodascopsis tothii]|uniref:S-adenosyl-L-methionine-dependent methyltransferase n=1 Tax=Dipodascopsis tothii TaxID=44089 RepID=UPI0034CD3D37